MKLIMRIKVAIVTMFCVLIVATLFIHGQTKVLFPDFIAQLKTITYHMTAFDKSLLDFNITQAYLSDSDLKGPL